MPEDYRVKESGGSSYIFVPADQLAYAFQYPGNGDYSYPSADISGTSLTYTWKDQTGSPIAVVGLQTGSAVATINGSGTDIVMGPFVEGGRTFVPVNLLFELLGMEADTFRDVVYFHYKTDFSAAALSGSWNTSDVSICTGYKDVVSGLVSLSSFDFSYVFSPDGTYNLGFAKTGSYNDELLLQSGRYKVLGFSVICYDILETKYAGTPYLLSYRNKALADPEILFISEYDTAEKKIRLDGTWYHHP